MSKAHLHLSGLLILAFFAAPSTGQAQIVNLQVPGLFGGGGVGIGGVGAPVIVPYAGSVGLPTIGPNVWPTIGPTVGVGPLDGGLMTTRNQLLNRRLNRNTTNQQRLNNTPQPTPESQTAANRRPANTPALGVVFGEGLEVNTVVDEGAAARAGLQPGDSIIAINGSQLRSPSELVTYLQRRTRVGQRVELLIVRDNTRQRLKAVLGTAQIFSEQNSELAQSVAGYSPKASDLDVPSAPVRSASKIPARASGEVEPTGGR